MPIDPISHSIHHISNDHLAGEASFDDIADELLALLALLEARDGETVIVAAHDVGFDISVLRYELQQTDRDLPDVPVLDTMGPLVALAGGELHRPSLNDLIGLGERERAVPALVPGDLWVGPVGGERRGVLRPEPARITRRSVLRSSKAMSGVRLPSCTADGVVGFVVRLVVVMADSIPLGRWCAHHELLGRVGSAGDVPSRQHGGGDGQRGEAVADGEEDRGGADEGRDEGSWQRPREQHILARLGVTNRGEAAAVAHRAGLAVEATSRPPAAARRRR